MSGELLAAVGSLIVAAVALFYSIGRDKTDSPVTSPSCIDARLDDIVEQMREINTKFDRIADWQREITATYSTHDQQIANLLSRVDNLEKWRDIQDNAILGTLQNIAKKLEDSQK